jgi:hypothetical protein
MRLSTIRAVAIAAAFAIAVAGCTAKPPVPSPSPSETVEVLPIGPLGAAGCAPASPIVDGLPEIQGTPTSSETSLYGWIMPTSEGPTIRTNAELKVVWRMVGEGDLVATLVAPDGTEGPILWGPDAHGSSNYERPGREWGTGLLFTTTGCWELKLATDTTAASVWFDVVS